MTYQLSIQLNYVLKYFNEEITTTPAIEWTNSATTAKISSSSQC